MPFSSKWLLWAWLQPSIWAKPCKTCSPHCWTSKRVVLNLSSCGVPPTSWCLAHSHYTLQLIAGCDASRSQFSWLFTLYSALKIFVCAVSTDAMYVARVENTRPSLLTALCLPERWLSLIIGAQKFILQMFLLRWVRFCLMSFTQRWRASQRARSPQRR